MDKQERYTLGELARLAGVTPRTIRYYTTEGLLPAPDARGRYASYNVEHLRRLEQIAQMKADYLPLSVIRERLEGEGAIDTSGGQAGHRQGKQPAAYGRIAEAAAAYDVGGAPSGPQLHASGASLLPEGALNPFRLAPASQPQVGRVEFFPDEPATQSADDDDKLAALLKELNAGKPTAETEVWRCLVVAPGVEVRLREPISARRRRRIEELVAALRDRLLGEEEES